VTSRSRGSAVVQELGLYRPKVDLDVVAGEFATKPGEEPPAFVRVRDGLVVMVSAGVVVEVLLEMFLPGEEVVRELGRDSHGRCRVAETAASAPERDNAHVVAHEAQLVARSLDRRSEGRLRAMAATRSTLAHEGGSVAVLFGPLLSPLLSMASIGSKSRRKSRTKIALAKSETRAPGGFRTPNF
jgi:hypothetical protein